ncbi:serine/threonine protein phosphatase 1 [Neorhodopirellula lusitana]|uniref:Serine/threonine protein phosphatase 1 n=1 Tax=Neorhodopirellula lusitana TaxID=445327 RepID=A0ABY1QBJ7_9BACT|nr:metallophosphoesterase family protein [Neorhodopirellula lusitana]SMP63447.1 serine/threonine protein phosphatase 1 [Neorhodopirellula lusitana]
MARYVIGDVHGCSKALRSMLETLKPGSGDEVILVGDYVDRGPNSKDVVDQLLTLQQCCELTVLRGNHEVMLQGVTMNDMDATTWIENGGNTTIASYGGSATKIPSNHLDFFQGLKRYHETETEIFVHAMYDPQQPIGEQSDELTYWTHLPKVVPAPHVSGKRIYMGHTPQPNGEILRRSHMVVVDTYCFGGGFLTALDLETDAIVQADRHGHVRRVPIEHLYLAALKCIDWLRGKGGESEGG